MTIHICKPKLLSAERILKFCPTCQGLRYFLAEYFEWYGSTQTCLDCGDEWNDGERSPRPFMRGWRAKNIEAAKARLTSALKLTGGDSATPEVLSDQPGLSSPEGDPGLFPPAA